MAQIREIGEVTFEYNDQSITKYYSQDDVTGRIYENSNKKSEKYVNAPIPTEIIIENQIEGYFEEKATVTDVLDFINEPNKISQVIYFKVKSLNVHVYLTNDSSYDEEYGWDNSRLSYSLSVLIDNFKGSGKI